MGVRIEELNEYEKNRIQSCYMLGILAQDDESFPRVGIDTKCVTIMRGSQQNSIIFFLKRLTELPFKMIDNESNKYAICFADYIPEQLKKKIDPSFNYLSDNQKIEKIRETLSNNLVVFKPYLQNNHFNATIFNFVKKPNDFNIIDSQYITIPVIDDDEKSFDDKILKYLPINFAEYNDEIGEPELIPKYVICNNKMYFFDKWSLNSNSSRVAQNIDRIKYIELPNKFEKNSINLIDNKLITVSKEKVEELKKIADREGKSVLHENSDIVKTVLEIAKDNGLIYNPKDIFRFDLAVKTGGLVILSGMSGVGKSKLVEIYAKALNLDEASHSDNISERGGLYKIIPVKSSWADDTDLIGYLDTINNLYRPADNGLVKLLIQAEQNSNKKYIICLDEMNLSRAEYYFSDFLSILETENRVLQLYSPSEKVYNQSEYKDKVRIGNNVYFIGTVNVDESTFRFSDKVLDRANVIRMEPCKFIDWYNLLADKDKAIGWSKEEIMFLDDLNELLIKYDSQKAIGYRVVKQIQDYVKQITPNEYFDRKEAFDLQIVQRVLPKVRGTKDIIGDLVGRYDETTGLDHSLIYNICLNYKNVSEFVNVEKELIRKARELKNYEYTA